MGENHSFWLLKRFLIFQGISGDLDANLLKHISLKIQRRKRGRTLIGDEEQTEGGEGGSLLESSS